MVVTLHLGCAAVVWALGSSLSEREVLQVCVLGFDCTCQVGFLGKDVYAYGVSILGVVGSSHLGVLKGAYQEIILYRGGTHGGQPLLKNFCGGGANSPGAQGARKELKLRQMILYIVMRS